MNYNFKIDLSKIFRTRIIEENGEKYVVIPVEKNDIYLTDKGSAYMNFTCREMKTEMYGQTHFIKQNVSKKMFKAMTDEERKNIPIIGGLSPDGGGQGNYSQGSQKQFGASTNNASSNNTTNNYDNLPF